MSTVPGSPSLPPVASRYRWGSFLFAPIWAALSAALSAAVPLAAPLLLPMGAARLTRALMIPGGLLRGLSIAALGVPAALIIGTVLSPLGGFYTAALAAALISLPAVALFVGVLHGCRRDRLTILVAAVTGIGTLAVLLGFAFSTGRDPGGFLASRIAGVIPEIIASYRSRGWSEEWLAAAGRGLTLFGALIELQLPGLVLGLSVVYAAAMTYPFGRLAGLPPGGPVESFSRFTTPIAGAFVFVPAGLLAALGGAESRIVAIDVLIPLAILFFLRGLAIIRALLDKGRAGFIGRALVYTLVLQMPFPLILALGGLFDEFLNIRGRLDKAAASAGTRGTDV